MWEVWEVRRPSEHLLVNLIKTHFEIEKRSFFLKIFRLVKMGVEPPTPPTETHTSVRI